MCWECDHPESSHQDYLDHMQGLIDRFGWAVVGVEDDAGHPPWAYTLGLPPLGRPELVMTGMRLPRATWLLNVEGGPRMEVVRARWRAAGSRPAHHFADEGGLLSHV
jgi:hypothetical protein